MTSKRQHPSASTKPLSKLDPARREFVLDLLSWGTILAAVLLFFSDAIFSGKNFLSQGDNVAFYSFIPYLKAAKAAGEFPLWVPYIFSGMPSLASFLAAGERTWDIVGMILFSIPKFFGELTANDTTRLALWYAIYGWGVYSLMRVKRHDRLVAIFSSVAAIFSTFVIVWVMIGHSTKPVSLATLPWILLSLERMRERFSLTNLFIVILAMIALVTATHPQMMFYMGCAAAIYLLIELIIRLITKQGALSVLKAGAGLAVATLIALGTHADMFLATRDYTPHSTRGSAPIVQMQDKTTDQAGGNDYEYATNWSFSPGEMATFLIPNYYGFGNLSAKMSGSAREQQTNLYWGQMPFTDAANYMGIGVLLLAVIGIFFNRRDPFVIFLTVLGLFSLLLSFGKNFPLLYDVFYNMVPSFNKFRAPSMALCLLQFATPVLAGYGLSAVLRWHKNKEMRRTAKWIAALTSAFLVIGFAYTTISEATYKRTVAEALAEKEPKQFRSPDDVSPQYTQVVFDNMRSDWIASGFIAAGFGLMILLVVSGSMSPKFVPPVAILLVLIDLWRVDARPYEPREGTPEKNVFRKYDVVDFIKSDPGVFRIADVSGSLPANWWAYFLIENVHGYSSAKLRLYQDMLDVAARGSGQQPVPGNSVITSPFMWNLLNVKYVVSRQQLSGIAAAFQSPTTGMFVYKNDNYLPRAWFVDSVKIERSAANVLNKLRDGSFDARKTAWVENDVRGQITAPDSAATARITHRGNQTMAIETNNTNASFLVVSEIYYPEWHCYLDGKEVTIHKADFLLRGIAVPEGKHTVEFRFDSPAFERGRMISMASNGFALLIGFAGIFIDRRRKKSETIPA
ncbi:MAG: YfhO family protein [Ignavibacteria bacterium]|nr:YfhO family protein [Ignavibacteria bacterium]